MLFKVLLCLSLLHVMVSAGERYREGEWKKIANDQCVHARNNRYKEFTYYGPNTFIIAMRLIHKKGKIGCAPRRFSNWGCDSHLATNIIVTDTRNKRIYPAPSLVSLRAGGWYDLPGYGTDSPDLVFADPGFHYLYYGMKMRLWYGEDLFNSTEGDNHGFTCMDVYVYVTSA